MYHFVEVGWVGLMSTLTKNGRGETAKLFDLL